MHAFNNYSRLWAAAGQPGGDGGGAGGTAAGLPPVAHKPDEATARLQAELNRTKQDLQNLQSRIFAPQPQQVPATPGAPNAQPAPDEKRALEREFLKSPLDYSTAIAERTAMNVAGRMVGPMLATARENARQLARGADPVEQRIWDKYEPQITAIVDSTCTPDIQANVQVWQNGLNQVKGRYAKEIAQEFYGVQPTQPPEGPRAPGVIIRQGQGPAPAGTAAVPAPPNEHLTADERKFHQKYFNNLTEEQYLQGKRDNLSQNDEHMDPVGKSSWDKYITFDSRVARRERRAAQQQAAQRSR